MENKFLKKVLSAITSMAVALLFMTGVPFSKLDMSITASAEAATLDLTGFDYSTDSSGTGWSYNSDSTTLSILNGYELTVTGTFTKTVSNNGTIASGTTATFSGTVYNDSKGVIEGGTFSGPVTNYKEINGGTFSGKVTNYEDLGIINGGTFSGTVFNNRGCEINGGTFTTTSTVNNQASAVINDGEFYGTINNNINGEYFATISGGTYKSGSTVNNKGRIQGGTFESGSTIANSGTITDTMLGNIPSGVITCAGSHTVGTPATCKTQAICSICGQSYGETAPHTFVDGTCNVSGCGAVATIEYTHGGSTYYTDDFSEAVSAINNNGGGTITLRADVDCSDVEYIQVTDDLILNLGTHTLDLGTGTLLFGGSIDASIIGTGTIKSVYDSMVQNSGQAVYVVGGASLTVGTENGSGPTISGGANAITTSNDAANELMIYAGTFNGACHFSSSGSYTNNIKGGTFKDEVYANYTQIDGGTFKKNINCVNGSCIVINACECEGSLKIGQENTATKYVTLNGGSFAQGIENQTADGKTTDFLGTDRYYVDEDGQLIEIADADDAGYDIAQYVIVAPVHTVTFETNDYGGEDFEKKVADGFAVKEPTEPTDPNVNFGGWYKDSALSTAWNFTNDKITSDVTIYAKWTTNQVAQVETPVITPASGTSFDDTLEVTITCATADADIYYTTDGTTPTAAGTKYTGAITLTDSKTVKAFAIKSGMTDSEVATADYRKNATVTPAPNPTPNPTPDPEPKPIVTPVPNPISRQDFPPEDVSSESGTTVEEVEVLIDDGTNPYAAVISFVGLVLSVSAIIIARKKNKQ